MSSIDESLNGATSTVVNTNPATQETLGKDVTAAPGTETEQQTTKTSASVAGHEVVMQRTHAAATHVGRLSNRAYDTTRRGLLAVRNKIESLPTPGGILLPLGVLFIFFMLLLPVNGHTRLMWLWLAVTGNAEIGQALVAPTQNAVITPTIVKPSTGVNPNQTGTTTPKPASNTNKSPIRPAASTSQPTTATAKKSSIHVTTNTSKKHGGAGPDTLGLPDPTAPIAQASYSYLLGGSAGYE